MRSLKARLGFGLILILVVVFAIQFVLVSLAIRQVTENYMTGRMERDIDTLLAGLVISPEGIPALTGHVHQQGETLPYSGHYYRIVAGDQVLKSRSIWDHPFDIPALTPGDSRLQREDGPLQQSLLVLSRGFMKSGYPVTITVAEDMSDANNRISEFNQQYFLLSAGMLLLLLLLQLWLIGGSLRSLTATRLDLNRLARGETETLAVDVPQEILPLVHEINLLLERLSRRLAQTRTAVGNLAHALKTPLSVLYKISMDPVLEQKPDMQARLKQQLAAIESTVDRELNRARLAGDGKSGHRFNPGVDVPMLIDTLRQIHSHRQLEINRQIDADAVWMANREDMLELLGNLLDNACKWAVSKVRVSLRDSHVITVEDDGPGCAPETLEMLTQRGTRLDETVAGHGLGLSIAGDIVNHYNGHMTFGTSTDLGGLEVVVKLNRE